MGGFAGLMLVVIVAVLVLVVGLRWPSGGRARPIDAADSERLERLESALTGLESRLDELQDQQRFLERLLAERPDDRSLGSGDEGSGSGADGGDSILFDTSRGDGTADR